MVLEILYNMDGEKCEQNIMVSTEMESQSDETRFRRHILQNSVLLWLDSDVDESSRDFQNMKTQLQTVVNNIKVFTKPDPCVDFLTDTNEAKVFMITSKTIGEQIVPLIHDVPQLDSIYILSDNESRDEEFIEKWFKVKDEFTQIISIYETLKKAIKECDQNSFSISFVSTEDDSSDPSLGQLDPSFMYTQLFKEILLEMEHNENSIKTLTDYWRSLYVNNEPQFRIIDDFERDYHPQSSILWYTKYPFIFQILNQALRTIKADVLVKMGFFIRDLHHEIKELHTQQFSSLDKLPYRLYRGQALMKEDFEKLMKTKAGLMSFNNFLSTSRDRVLSLVMAESNLSNPDNVGILFEITIDSQIPSSVFARIDDASHFKEEQEVLFSMHSVFRIGKITKINDSQQLYQVDLVLTSEDDQKLRILTDHIRKEIPATTGWERLGSLLDKLSEYELLEELYKVLLANTSEQQEQATILNGLGCTKAHKGDYTEAIRYCGQAKEIWQKHLSSDDPRLALSYQNIASVYRYMGEYSEAFSLSEKAVEILQKVLPANHSKLAHSYYETASLYAKVENYRNAISFYNKSLKIYKEVLPENHPSVGSCYEQIGEIYSSIGMYSEALSFHNKALSIYRTSLPSNHPKLANSKNNIGEVYLNMGQYSEARSFYDKALEISKKFLPPKHPDWAYFYEKFGTMSFKLGEYSKAFLYYETALDIYQRTYPLYHPNLAISYNNIGGVYFTTGEYSKAISFYEKALDIYQKNLIPNLAALAASYNNIGLAYRKMEEYSKALPFLNTGLEILQKCLPPNHPNFAASYNNIGLLYMHMKEYPKALQLVHKAIEICQAALPVNLPLLGTSYNYLYLVYCNMGNYSEALTYGERALEISRLSLPANHPDLQILRANLNVIRKKS